MTNIQIQRKYQLHIVDKMEELSIIETVTIFTRDRNTISLQKHFIAFIFH